MDGPTISDVARLAGVSAKTVDRAVNGSPLLNEETHAKVRRAIAKTGFVPDFAVRPLEPGRNPLIFLLHDDPLASALTEAQAGMSAALQGSGWLLCVEQLDRGANAEAAFKAFLEHHRPAGILLMPPLAEQDRLAGLAWEYGCRCARLGAEPQHDAPGWAFTPDRQGTREAIAWLIGMGHRRIGLISGREDLRSARLRELGYLDAMAEHGLDRGPSLIASGDDTFESGFAAAELLLEVSPSPTAIFVSNDDMAAGAIHAAVSRKIQVPTALSVLGFDDAPIASRICPPLTSVRVPLLEMAYVATQALIDPEVTASPPCEFPLELIERGSVAPPQAATGAPSAFFQAG